jgi:hypothetical protein
MCDTVFDMRIGGPCRDCGDTAHPGQTCQEVREARQEALRVFFADFMAKQLADKATRAAIRTAPDPMDEWNYGG